MISKDSFSFLILTYNSSKILAACIDSIRSNFNYEYYDIIVIDNNSDDSEITQEISRQREVSFIQNLSNDGYAAGYNEILGHQLGDYLVFMNPDARIVKFEANSIAKICESNSDLFGVQLVNISGRKELSFFYDWKFQTPLNQSFTLKLRSHLRLFSSKKMWINGPFFIVRKHAFLSVNGFDSRTFLYNEEICLKYKLLQLRGEYRAEFMDGVMVYHMAKETRADATALITSINSALEVCESMGVSKEYYIRIRMNHLRFRRKLNYSNVQVRQELGKVIEYLKECR